MAFLTGPVEFNGAAGKYSVALRENSYEREIRVGEVLFWDAFDGECYWQSDFGSPIYRRPSPFSMHEGREWLRVWQSRAASNAETEWQIDSPLGNTLIQHRPGSLTARTGSGNVSIYGEPKISEAEVSLHPPDVPRLDFSLPFDLSLGVPRARISIGGKQVQAMIDTGADHSIFSEALPHTDLGLTVKVGAVGGTVDMRVGELQDVNIAGIAFPRLTTLVTSFDSFPGPFRYLRGFIGQDILARGAISFDHQRGILSCASQ